MWKIYDVIYHGIYGLSIPQDNLNPTHQFVFNLDKI